MNQRLVFMWQYFQHEPSALSSSRNTAWDITNTGTHQPVLTRHLATPMKRAHFRALLDITWEWSDLYDVTLQVCITVPRKRPVIVQNTRTLDSSEPFPPLHIRLLVIGLGNHLAASGLNRANRGRALHFTCRLCSNCPRCRTCGMSRPDIQCPLPMWLAVFHANLCPTFQHLLPMDEKE